MLNATFALKIFEGFSIERWNDMIRPFDIVEMDKAAEKMVLVYIIGKFEENAAGETEAAVDWEWLIEASFFDLLKKIALCDIKSPVQRMIKHDYLLEYQKLDNWVLAQYQDCIDDAELLSHFAGYLQESAAGFSDAAPLRRRSARILRAAHKFSTLREFQMLSPVNEAERLKNIDHDLSLDIVEYMDLKGVQHLVTKQRPLEFLMRVEQLRFQTRWHQTPRVPKTSVLGHSFFVAIITFLLTRHIASPLTARRKFNNYFSALFHDLPEAVTRDIVSPVKRATEGISDIIKEIEERFVEREMLPLMEDFYRNELIYFTNDEFENRIITAEGKTRRVSFSDLNTKYNADVFSPVDGALVRCADHISAFIEATQSIQHGITSAHLREGRDNVLETYRRHDSINDFDIAAFLATFK